PVPSQKHSDRADSTSAITTTRAATFSSPSRSKKCFKGLFPQYATGVVREVGPFRVRGRGISQRRPLVANENSRCVHSNIDPARQCSGRNQSEPESRSWPRRRISAHGRM